MDIAPQALTAFNEDTAPLTLKDRPLTADMMSWDSDTFAETVEYVLNALYEYKIDGTAKKYRRPYTLYTKEVQRMRRFGAFFLPQTNWLYPTRVFQEYLGENLPTEAGISIYGEFDEIEDDGLIRADKFATHFAFRLLGKHPDIIRASGKDHPLYVRYLVMTKGRKLLIHKSFFTVHPKTGTCWPAYGKMQKQGNDYFTSKGYEILPVDDGDEIVKASGISGITLNSWADRRYFWLVKAEEPRPGSTAIATFAVAPDQIRSLFYARNLPMTAAGNKRPILHWVRSHKRRLEEGVEVDVREHMRGVTEFVMGGAKFSIYQPLKTAGEPYDEVFPKRDGTPVPLKNTTLPEPKPKPTLRKRFTNWLLDIIRRSIP